MDVYSIITERIIEKLEQGHGPEAPAVAERRSTTQPRVKEALSRR